MSRPREFDEAVVLDAAIQCFWAYGYRATSTRNLADAMGITGASLYNAFGDKRLLFHRSLKRYVDEKVGLRISRLEGDYPPRQAIEKFFEEIIERSVGDSERKGCFLINCVLEGGPHDPPLQHLIRKTLLRIERFLFRCVLEGQRDGTISAAHESKDLGRTLLAVLFGIRVLARNGPKREVMESLLRPVLALLDAKST